MSQTTTPTRHALTVLFVDDESMILRAIQRQLVRSPYRVLIANDAAEALAIARVEHIDVVVSDHRMPNITGVELLKELRALYPRILRVMLTGAIDMDGMVHAINDSQVFAMLTKPWSRDELDAVLARCAAFLASLGGAAQPRFVAPKPLELTRAQTRDGLETKFPGITEVKRLRNGAVSLDLGELVESEQELHALLAAS